MAHATTRAFADERRSAIMEMLEHNASVQVAEIAQTFGVSSVTARADLDALAESGKLRRTHGGDIDVDTAILGGYGQSLLERHSAAMRAAQLAGLGESV